MLSFLHLPAAVNVMSLFGSEAVLEATMRRCLIYTHYFLYFLVGIEGRRKKLHGMSRSEGRRKNVFYYVIQIVKTNSTLLKMTCRYS